MHCSGSTIRSGAWQLLAQKPEHHWRQTGQIVSWLRRLCWLPWVLMIAQECDLRHLEMLTLSWM